MNKGFCFWNSVREFAPAPAKNVIALGCANAENEDAMSNAAKTNIGASFRLTKLKRRGSACEIEGFHSLQTSCVGGSLEGGTQFPTATVFCSLRFSTHILLQCSFQ